MLKANPTVGIVGYLGRWAAGTRRLFADDDSSSTTRPSRPGCASHLPSRLSGYVRLENFSSDWNHLNVRGQAEIAEITWPAAAALLELS